MKHVFVNGVPVLKDGEHTGALPGRALKGPGAAAALTVADRHRRHRSERVRGPTRGRRGRRARPAGRRRGALARRRRARCARPAARRSPSARLSSPELRRARRGRARDRAPGHDRLRAAGRDLRVRQRGGHAQVARMASEVGRDPRSCSSAASASRATAWRRAARTATSCRSSRPRSRLYRTGVPAVVFRPSYILGPGDGLVTSAAARHGRGRRRDAGRRPLPDAADRGRGRGGRRADAATEPAAAASGDRAHRVIDLVGPEPVTYRRVRRALRGRGASRSGVRPTSCCAMVPVAEADRQARRGRLPRHAARRARLPALRRGRRRRAARGPLGRPLRPLDEAIAAAVDDTPLPQ